MTNAPREHKRRRLRDWNYSANGAYFITFCTHERVSILGSICFHETSLDACAEFVPSQIGAICVERIRELAEQTGKLSIDAYVVMPNHVHLLVSVVQYGSDASSSDELRAQAIPLLVSKIKTHVTRIARNQGLDHTLWQKSYHDHIVRSKDEYNRIREYIANNPLKWALDKFYVDPRE